MEDVAPTLYYRWMYRTIRGAMYDEFERLRPKALRQEIRVLAQNHHLGELFPRLLANATAMVGRRPHRRGGCFGNSGCRPRSCASGRRRRWATTRVSGIMVVSTRSCTATR